MSTIHWVEAQPCSARWHSESGLPLPRRVVVADDLMPAAVAHRLACEGTALLWRGDFHNARQLLRAMDRRVGRSAPDGGGPAAEVFHAQRRFRAHRARVLGKLLVRTGRRGHVTVAAGGWRLAAGGGVSPGSCPQSSVVRPEGGARDVWCVLSACRAESPVRDALGGFVRCGEGVPPARAGGAHRLGRSRELEGVCRALRGGRDSADQAYGCDGRVKRPRWKSSGSDGSSAVPRAFTRPTTMRWSPPVWTAWIAQSIHATAPVSRGEPDTGAAS